MSPITSYKIIIWNLLSDPMKFRWKVRFPSTVIVLNSNFWYYLFRYFFFHFSHDMMMCVGFQWLHGGKVLTIFSAPNYCGEYGNRAALARFVRGQGGRPQIVQFKEKTVSMSAE